MIRTFHLISGIRFNESGSDTKTIEALEAEIADTGKAEVTLSFYTGGKCFQTLAYVRMSVTAMTETQPMVWHLRLRLAEDIPPLRAFDGNREFDMTFYGLKQYGELRIEVEME